MVGPCSHTFSDRGLTPFTCTFLHDGFKPVPHLGHLGTPGLALCLQTALQRLAAMWPSPPNLPGLSPLDPLPSTVLKQMWAHPPQSTVPAAPRVMQY